VARDLQAAALGTNTVDDPEPVITMGCGDACPIYPGKRYEDWELDDPAASRSR
jgi:arsenate reductase